MELWNERTETGGQDMDVYAQIEQLRRMTPRELRERYREVWGEESAATNQQHLMRRIAWRLQALAEGDLSKRALDRARQIAQDAELSDQVPLVTGRLRRAAGKRRQTRRDRRLPAPGAELSRVYRDQTLVVRVLAQGFEYEGRRYRSLSAVAREATGTRWNGLVFFGLAKRGESARCKRGKTAANGKASRAA
jgi:hypothetical protein